jgi:hypothetical protein
VFGALVCATGIFHLTAEVRLLPESSSITAARTAAKIVDLKDFGVAPIYVHVRRPGFETSMISPAGLFEPDSNDQVCCCEASLSTLIVFVFILGFDWSSSMACSNHSLRKSCVKCFFFFCNPIDC